MAGMLRIYQERSNSIPNYAMLNAESALFNTGTNIHCTGTDIANNIPGNPTMVPVLVRYQS